MTHLTVFYREISAPIKGLRRQEGRMIRDRLKVKTMTQYLALKIRNIKPQTSILFFLTPQYKEITP